MTNILILHLQDLVHGEYPSRCEVVNVLVHFNGLQPFGHGPEGRTVRAAGAWQTD